MDCKTSAGELHSAAGEMQKKNFDENIEIWYNLFDLRGETMERKSNDGSRQIKRNCRETKG